MRMVAHPHYVMMIGCSLLMVKFVLSIITLQIVFMIDIGLSGLQLILLLLITLTVLDVAIDLTEVN
jgi:hypothetical protein